MRARSAPACTGTFEPISAQDFVDAMNPAWNLGNTLDAVEDEGDWNNPPVQDYTFDDVIAAGFKGVRIPITWAYHFVSESPDWTVDPEWLQRVEDVVDMAVSRGLPTIVNVHHDSWIWADVSLDDAHIDMIEERFYQLWYQIGQKLGCKSQLLAFEPLNEPAGSTQEHAQEYNKMNEIFLKALKDAGGLNSQRVVTLVGLNMDAGKTSQWFEPPTINFTNPWALQYHYYSPYDFIFSAWGKTIWGSDNDKTALDTDLSIMRNNFTNIPLIIGEYAASPVATETAARWKWLDYFVRAAVKYNTPTVLWDNGNDFLDRSTHTWHDRSAIDIITNATAGIANSLADSTVDPNADTQWTSAYVFHEVGDGVGEQSLPFIFNGNSVVSIFTIEGDELLEDDYSISDDSITLSAEFLSQYFSTDGAPGVKGEVLVSFSAGADLGIQIVQWDTPILGTTSASLFSVQGSDLYIPIEWAGLSKPATVKIMRRDGTIVFDDWTQWLGPLQQGRATYSNQWNWDDSNLIVALSAISTIASTNQTTWFEWEFYPRVPGNTVNYTLNT
ncbi:glycoside hydrolase superfamily [Lineolata rhizophorae]|uniref:Glycoside hydrolase superfamily n=1 Tax=Lineolata rhizophorae TaxID=578093 RepID=A0A6A6P9J5_9PEZI|nr:glycoside hydrolase superfamily [Lineolata rhizophorae]